MMNQESLRKGEKLKYKILSELASFESTFPKIFCPQRKKEFVLNFVYPAVGEGSSYIPLFKTLLTNKCIKNCYYCANRSERNVERYEFKPNELANLFMEYYKKNWAKGLFLSSSIYPNSNISQEKMLETIKILREKYNYNGYIHCKILPGIDEGLIYEVGRYSDRLSINLEGPGENFLKKLSPDKKYKDELIKLLESLNRYQQSFPLKYGITTQFIVGAGKETDKDLLLYSHFLYKKYNLRRVYYCAFTPIVETPFETLPECSRIREYRLYQADFLLRKYNFKPLDFVYDTTGNLVIDKDPKLAYAVKNQHLYPIEVNRADYFELLKVPGIGPRSAKRIVELRKEMKFRKAEELKKVGVVVKRALNFLTLDGKFYKTEKMVMDKPSRQLFIWEERQVPVFTI